MSTRKYYLLACLIVAMLLSACGGGSTETTTKVVNLDKTSYVYMAGDYVEGLSYSAKTLSGITGKKGVFAYRAGEAVTFKIGTKTIGTYTPPTYPVSTVTHFSILGTNNPYDTAVVNLSVLLHFLDSDSANSLSNGFQISADRLAVAEKVTVELSDKSYLEQLVKLAEKAAPPLTVPDRSSVLAFAKAQSIVDKIQVAPFPAATVAFNEFKSTVTLSALDSTDANGDKLTYQWFIDSKPKTSKAVIATPTLDTITVGIDADDEPYIFRVLVADSVSAVPLSLTANFPRTNIAGVYSSGSAQISERRVVVISDTAEVWGYTFTASNTTTSRAFTGLVSRADKAIDYDMKSLISCDQIFPAMSPAACPTRKLADSAFQLNSTPTTRTLTGPIGGSNQYSLVANAALDAPTLLTSLAGTYKEQHGPTSKNWVISKTTFSYSETSADGKPVVCATGDIKVDANSQVLDANGAVTKFAIPIKIEFKAACDDGFDPNTSTTGVLFSDLSIGIAGYTFIGKNPSQSSIFVRHFIRQ
jgi:hypothetical protein